MEKGIWIKEPHNIRSEASQYYDVRFIYKQGNIYIMDNHLAAAYCWLYELNKKENFNFFHIDRHEDLGRNAPLESYSIIKDSIHMPLAWFLSMKYEMRGGKVEQCFKWDNYIMQMQRLFPNWFRKCCFACHDFVDDDRGLDIVTQFNNINLLWSISDVTQWGSAMLKEEKDNRWIINLDLDYFFCFNEFDSNYFQFLTFKYIQCFCKDLKNAIEKSRKIAVVTIALSPECCGGWDNAIPIANEVAKGLELDFRL